MDSTIEIASLSSPSNKASPIAALASAGVRRAHFSAARLANRAVTASID